MSRVQTKTDNSYLSLKIKQRLNHLPEKENIKVLDCFSGKSKIWNEIKRKTNKSIDVISIDKIKYANNLRGDNVKYLKAMNLDKYDVIDLDAYGVPFKQLEIIFKKEYKGAIFITFIQSMYGCLPIKMLRILGYTRSMIRKCPTLFNMNGIDKFGRYLATKGIKKIYRITKRGNKHYIFIEKAVKIE
jgi:hypothetical protein